MSDDDGIQAWAPIEVVEWLLKRAEQAEADIQRVREECARIPYNGNAAWTAGYTAACQRVRRALDGER